MTLLLAENKFSPFKRNLRFEDFSTIYLENAPLLQVTEGNHFYRRRKSTKRHKSDEIIRRSFLVKGASNYKPAPPPPIPPPTIAFIPGEIFIATRRKNDATETFSSHGRMEIEGSTTSRTSCNRPPKMRRFSGRLREVIAYKNRHTGSLFREEVPAHLPFGREFISCSF